MVADRQFDLQKYFTDGYTVTRIDRSICDLLLNEVRLQPFNLESQREQTNPVLPTWDTAYNKKTSDNVAPEQFRQFWHEVSKQSYFDYFNLIYGEFSQFNIMLHRYDQATGLQWHQDVHEGVHITNVLYLTAEDQWDEQDGGYLKLGRWKLDSNGWGRLDTVEQVGTVLPYHGTLVSICNVVPTFCHSVEQMKKGKERYSLICRFGYKENTDKNQIGSLF